VGCTPRALAANRPAGAAPPQQQQQQQQQPEQVVVQDDLDQLLDILPAELGALLISHPKRPQLIEVRAVGRARAGLTRLGQVPWHACWRVLSSERAWCTFKCAALAATLTGGVGPRAPP
jgi:hypothetical protein